MESHPLFQSNGELILASNSPRRRDMLSSLGLQFSICPADIDEQLRPGEQPAIYARRLALSKARRISSQHREATVIGADTVVVQDGRIHGKPGNDAAALHTLRQLQGRRHQVITAVAVIHCNKKVETVFDSTTEVVFGAFDDNILSAYIRTGEPADKAGSYGIQGIGAFLVTSITGSYSNVVGLPLDRLLTTLIKYKLISPG
ncbi:MAG: hypothetical protein CSA34_03310 [Desulfobulbus propionicus]|nr:MAG: hypothetical protein CSA34_03310 [Desulfobulbus propionicus]